MPALARIESVGSPPDLLAEEELFALRVDGAVHRLGSVHVIAEGLGLSRLNVREWLAGKNIPVIGTVMTNLTTNTVEKT